MEGGSSYPRANGSAKLNGGSVPNEGKSRRKRRRQRHKCNAAKGSESSSNAPEGSDSVQSEKTSHEEIPPEVSVEEKSKTESAVAIPETCVGIATSEAVPHASEKVEEHYVGASQWHGSFQQSDLKGDENKGNTRASDNESAVHPPFEEGEAKLVVTSLGKANNGKESLANIAQGVGEDLFGRVAVPYPADGDSFASIVADSKDGSLSQKHKEEGKDGSGSVIGSCSQSGDAPKSEKKRKRRGRGKGMSSRPGSASFLASKEMKGEENARTNEERIPTGDLDEEKSKTETAVAIPETCVGIATSEAVPHASEKVEEHYVGASQWHGSFQQSDLKGDENKGNTRASDNESAVHPPFEEGEAKLVVTSLGKANNGKESLANIAQGVGEDLFGRVAVPYPADGDSFASIVADSKDGSLSQKHKEEGKDGSGSVIGSCSQSGDAPKSEKKRKRRGRGKGGNNSSKLSEGRENSLTKEINKKYSTENQSYSKNVSGSDLLKMKDVSTHDGGQHPPNISSFQPLKSLGNDAEKDGASKGKIFDTEGHSSTCGTRVDKIAASSASRSGAMSIEAKDTQRANTCSLEEKAKETEAKEALHLTTNDTFPLEVSRGTQVFETKNDLLVQENLSSGDGTDHTKAVENEEAQEVECNTISSLEPSANAQGSLEKDGTALVNGKSNIVSKHAQENIRDNPLRMDGLDDTNSSLLVDICPQKAIQETDKDNKRKGAASENKAKPFSSDQAKLTTKVHDRTVSGNLVCLIFKAVLHPGYLNTFWKKFKKVEIFFGEPVGRWEKGGGMEAYIEEREHNDGTKLVYFVAKDARRITKCQDIEYKYAFTDAKGNLNWEQFQIPNIHCSPLLNRVLKITKEELDNGEVVTYDGIIMPPKEKSLVTKVFSLLWTSEEKNINDALLTLIAFCPTFFPGKVPRPILDLKDLQEDIATTESILRNFKEKFFRENGRDQKKTISIKEIQLIVTQLEFAIEANESTVQEEETDFIWCRRLLRSLYIVFVVFTLGKNSKHYLSSSNVTGILSKLSPKKWSMLKEASRYESVKQLLSQQAGKMLGKLHDSVRWLLHILGTDQVWKRDISLWNLLWVLDISSSTASSLSRVIIEIGKLSEWELLSSDDFRVMLKVIPWVEDCVMELFTFDTLENFLNVMEIDVRKLLQKVTQFLQEPRSRLSVSLTEQVVSQLVEKLLWRATVVFDRGNSRYLLECGYLCFHICAHLSDFKRRKDCKWAAAVRALLQLSARFCSEAMTEKSNTGDSRPDLMEHGRVPKLFKDCLTYLWEDWSKDDAWAGSFPIKDRLEICNFLLQLDFGSDSLNSLIAADWTYPERFLSICQTRSESFIKAVCDLTLEKLNPTFAKSLEAAVFDIIAKGDDTDFFGAISKSRKFLWKLFECRFPSQKDVTSVLYHCLTWPPMNAYLKLPYADDTGDQGARMFQDAFGVLKDVINRLMDADVTVDELLLIHQRKSRFLELVSDLGNQNMDLQIDTLTMEYRYHEKIKDVLLGVLSLCSELAVSAEIKERCEENIRQKKIKDLYRHNESGEFEDLHFGLSKAELVCPKKISALGDNSLFVASWKSAVSKSLEKNDGNVSLKDIQEKIWKPVEEELMNMLHLLKTQKMRLCNVEGIFGKYESTVRLDDELSSLNLVIGNAGMGSKWIRACVEKIKVFLHLKRCASKAELMGNLVALLGLKGNFDHISMIQEQVMYELENKTLFDITQRLFEAAKSLSEIDDHMGECLKVFYDCKELVKWIKELESTKDMKDFNAFLALLDTTILDSDADSARISSLRRFSEAYRILIFDLTAESDLSDAITAVKKTSEEVKRKTVRLGDIGDTAKYLPWYKKKSKAFGSVEKTTMAELYSVNRKGLYTVKAPSEGGPFESKRETDWSLNGFISLVIDPYEEAKTLHYDQIKDLQSKVMLLGRTDEGEAQREKEYFIKVFEDVSRIASLHLRLCALGHACYLNWTYLYLCRFDGSDFNRCKEDDEIKLTIKELDCALENWVKEIDTERASSPALNHFTMQQLVYLRKGLFGIFKGSAAATLQPQAYALLKSMNPTLYPAIFGSHVYLPGSDQLDLEDNNALEDYWKKFPDTTSEALEDFIMSAVLEGYDESFVKATLAVFGPVVVEELLNYEESIEEGKVEGLSNRMDKILQQMKEEKSAEKLRKENQKDTSITSSEFLELKELGQFLNKLLTIGEERSTRAKQDSKEPVLVVAPKDEIYKRLLQVYQEKRKSLPRPFEVLICTATTTSEELELLFRRAFQDCRGIYSLAFVEELSYTAGFKAYETLADLRRQHAENHGASFELIIFCSLEGFGHSVLGSALELYRQPLIDAPSDDDIRKFLNSEFIVRSCHKSDVTASEADKERSTVRVAVSSVPGCGKSLFVSRTVATLSNLYGTKKREKPSKGLSRTVSIHGNAIDPDLVVRDLEEVMDVPGKEKARIFHFDIAPSVTKGLDKFVFELVVLGKIQTPNGRVWRRNEKDLCIFEVTETLGESKENGANVGYVLKLLPYVRCRTPTQCLMAYQKQTQGAHSGSQHPLFDQQVLQEECCQLVYQYLKVYAGNSSAVNLYTYQPSDVTDPPDAVLSVLLRFSQLRDPTWRQLMNFVQFLYYQFTNAEESNFCNMRLLGDILPGLKEFVVKFMLQMAMDFTTPSVDTATSGTNSGAYLLNLRRRWESSPHPYVFFNQDRASLTFLGFLVNSAGDLFVNGNELLMRGAISKNLMQGLATQGVSLNHSDQNWPRKKKLTDLCSVLGVRDFDPDETYDLTVDNIMKMLAIHMRLRSGIPVVIMGETGCGKTRLIKFLCALKAGENGPRNMILVKVHGGVSDSDIEASVNQAIRIAEQNSARNIETVLFFDEANTSTAISLIKEIMCDGRMNGRALPLQRVKLQVIAACNPYRKHSDKMIEKLEASGLGYHVGATNVHEKLGEIPLRHLVYRVHRLPASMTPLIWDFGQLSDKTEEVYMRQLVARYVKNGEIPNTDNFFDSFVAVLSASQKFMRLQQDECSFVSLRDVERAVQAFSWFYRKITKFPDFSPEEITDKDRSFVALSLSIGLCYYARLEARKEYLKMIGQILSQRNVVGYDAERMIKHSITRFQEMLMENVELNEDIAPNEALSENLFMMVICIELRIPLFIVGKPGSSKSLAKTIVRNSMRGELSSSEVFRCLKEVEMFSYQCSPFSTAEGIIDCFKKCSRSQKDRGTDKVAGVVVLDEVGLAEDSPLMPLKSLHPLLEDGTDGSEDLTLDRGNAKANRVSFVGISNWSLDPAKMNRGVMLRREVPSLEELVKTARGICSSERIQRTVCRLFYPLTKGYMEIYKMQKGKEELQGSCKEEFHGLRDFYCLIKCVYSFAKKCKGIPKSSELEFSVRRNFGGLEDFDAWEIFKHHLGSKFTSENEESEKLKTSVVDLITSNTRRTIDLRDTRYLLLMTDSYDALPVLCERIFGEIQNVSVIFGSKFPKDQEFSQICRDINRIKLCMDLGRTVILLNFESIYESLYDAFNQYYEIVCGQRLVDLGLGTHRVKCRVHEDFRLVVIAEKTTVYKKFPIPIINRLEKHLISVHSLLDPKQDELRKELDKWVHSFASYRNTSFRKGDVFVGFSNDTTGTLVLETAVYRNVQDLDSEKDETACLMPMKQKLLLCATPESVLRYYEKFNYEDPDHIFSTYFQVQKHSSLTDFIRFILGDRSHTGTMAQVTTFSRLLSPSDVEDVRGTLALADGLTVFNLSQFDTELEFTDGVRTFFAHKVRQERLLIIQCQDGDANNELLACTRHLCQEMWFQHRPDMMSFSEECSYGYHVVFVVQLQRQNFGCERFTMLSGNGWISLHVDDLRPSPRNLPCFLSELNTPPHVFFNIDTPDGEKFQKACGILEQCLQKVVSESNSQDTVKEGSPRARLSTLLDLLQEAKQGEGRASKFYHLVCRYLCKELTAKEPSMAYDASKWVFSQATDKRKILESGTFRNALLSLMTDWVVRILPPWIAQVDFENNLALLHDADKGKLWLDLLHCEELLLPTEDNRMERTEQAVDKFFCRFPFSHAISIKLKELIKLMNEGASDIEVRKMFEETSYGEILSHKISPRLLLDYLNDLVHYEFPQATKEEHELILRTINGMARARDVGQGSDFITLHTCLEEPRIRSRLEWFLSVSSVMPGVVDRLLTVINEGEELVLDVLFLFHGLRAEWDGMMKPITDYRLNRLCSLVERLTEPSITLFSQLTTDSVTPDVARMVEAVRMLWCQLSIVVMFIENVCPPATLLGWKYGYLVHSLLEHVGNLADPMSSEVSWLGIQRLFTRMISLRPERKIRHDCLKCSSQVQKATVMGCGHIFCEKCCKSILTDNPKCAICQTEFGKESKKGKTLKTEDFEVKEDELQRCCAKLYMDLAAHFCFQRNDKQPVAPGVLDLMIQNVIFFDENDIRTKEFSPFDKYKVDEKPVVRTFLLQQLMQMSDQQEVQEKLGHCLEELSKLTTERSHFDLCKLFITCHEDVMYPKVGDPRPKSLNSRVGKSLSSGYLDALRDPIFQLSAQRCVAYLRCVLHYLPEVIKKSLDFPSEVDAKAVHIIGQEFRNAAATMNDASGLLWTLLYRCAFRRYGMSLVNRMLESEHWSFFEGYNNKKSEVDCFIVYEEPYKEARGTFSSAVMERNVQRFLHYLERQDVQNPTTRFDIVRVLYSEVASKAVNKDPEEALNELPQALRGDAMLPIIATTKQLLKPACTLRRNRYQLKKHVQDILFHLGLALMPRGNIGVLRPLCDLAYHPNQVTNWFFPIMPEDEFGENVRITGGKIYECASGHRYIVTECGQPMQAGSCPYCRQAIGGTDHRLHASNRMATGEDRTQPCHILGVAADRPLTPVPVRNLSRVNCSLLSLLLHACMLVGASDAPQVVDGLARYSAPRKGIYEFLLEHIERDINQIGLSCSLNEDDVVILIHLLIKRLAQLPVDGTALTWKTKEERRAWEQFFCGSVIAPLLQNYQDQLTAVQHLLLEDERVGSNLFMRMLYEADVKTHDINKGLSFLEADEMWCYRQLVTVEHMRNVFDELPRGGRDYPVLYYYLHQDAQISLCSFLPDVLRFQAMLLSKVNRRIGKKVAKEKSIRDVIETEFPEVKKEMNKLLTDYLKTWKNALTYLENHGRVDIGKDNPTPDLVRCPLAYFLPSLEGPGRHAYRLVDFLAFHHNEFLTVVKNRAESSAQFVTLQNLEAGSAVKFQSQEDFLPLISAHCNYSWEPGKGARLEYDFASLERRLKRCFGSKPNVNIMIPTVSYQDDVHKSKFIVLLNKRIRQEQIPVHEHERFVNAFRSLEDVCKALDTVNTAMGFLKFADASPRMSFGEYIRDVLRFDVEKVFANDLMLSRCQLCHVHSVWTMLHVQRAKLLYLRGLDPFDVEKEFCQPLESPSLEFLWKVNLKYLITELTEFIVTDLHDYKDLASFDSLADSLQGFVESKGSTSKDLFREIPEEILLENVICFWSKCVDHEKKHSRGQ